MSVKKFLSGKKRMFGLLNIGNISISITKRHRFVIAVGLLSLGLFISENLFGKSGFYLALFLSVLTNLFLFASMYRDVRFAAMPIMYVLPFLYSLAFGLFYFLVPSRILSRFVLTSLYAVGLYSVFLTQNIFVVASMRTIALLSGARIVSFILALLTYFFLTNIVFSLHASLLVTACIIAGYSSLLILHSIWTHSLERSVISFLPWVGALSLSLVEVSLILWFWPSSATVISIFLTGFFYIIVGMSHVWLDKRLFKSVIWEYVWVGVIVLMILIFFTTWGG